MDLTRVVKYVTSDYFLIPCAYLKANFLSLFCYFKNNFFRTFHFLNIYKYGTEKMYARLFFTF